MAVEVETRSAPVTTSALHGAQPSRQIGMIWRETSPFAEQLNDVAHLVQQAASSLTKQ
jgi:LysR family hydrogen peroxide-inducible transcriptional activator